MTEGIYINGDASKMIYVTMDNIDKHLFRRQANGDETVDDLGATRRQWGSSPIIRII